MKCANCTTDLPDKAPFCWHCGFPQNNESLVNYHSFLNEIDQNFHYDFLRFSQITLQPGEMPVAVADWSYIFLGSDVYFGYLAVTPYRYISVAFQKPQENEKVIDTGIYTSKLIAPTFSPLTNLELSTRHITEIPLSYITSIQEVECPINNEHFTERSVFRFILGTPEDNDLAFGTRFFLYSKKVANKIQKTICYYNPKCKISRKKVSI